MKRKILDLLKEHYPDAASELNFKNAYELLVATVLAAQCTDARVNTVTPKLFSLYPNPAALANADKSELEQIIHSLGFYSTKSANLIAAAKRMVEEYGGEVPRSMDELVTLPGVGRKTASVVLSNAFDIPAFAVDTHVFRVSKRLGLASGKDVLTSEKELCALIPKSDWKDAHHWLLLHGRRVCSARKPKCGECFLNELCPKIDV